MLLFGRYVTIAKKTNSITVNKYLFVSLIDVDDFFLCDSTKQAYKLYENFLRKRKQQKGTTKKA